MPSIVQVTVHPSQFPENVQQALLNSLRVRQVNHKFLYDSLKQAQKWLALHEAYSPARTDPDCAETYENAFATAARKMADTPVHVIGLGCGGGQKDARLLQLFKQEGTRLSYAPCDVSLALVLVALQRANAVLADGACFPLVCDLAEADDLPAVFESSSPPEASRLITFFGMLPNFEPHVILARLGALLRTSDWLHLSANLAPGPDYAAGLEHIRPQYDNALTRDWLLTFLFDLGVKPSDGELRFVIEDCPRGTGLKRVVAAFHFSESRSVRVMSEEFVFRPGDSVRLFFSYRHTPDRVGELLQNNGIAVLDQWVTASQEEAVFLCRRPG